MQSTDQINADHEASQHSATPSGIPAVAPEQSSSLPPADETSGAVADVLALAESSGSLPTPINRVIDVPLTVMLRFGQRQLTVRELLELNTGSLVELDQQVEEPVNLMLGERIIARGEVVIVDGNYGMRVLEVVEHSAAQRLVALGRA